MEHLVHILLTLLIAIIVAAVLLKVIALLGLDARWTRIAQLIVALIFLIWLVRWFFFGDVIAWD